MPAFKVFLSHRYKSPETNLFFYHLLANQADLQFEVDEGVSYQPVTGGEAVRGLPTNVTRLERMVRDADAFIGIYPLSVPADSACSPAQLQQESRYFRLEMEIAVRSGKPALIVFDKRYKAGLEGPSTFFRCSFDAQEIQSAAAPSTASFTETFSGFCRSVSASMSYRATRGAATASAKVGLLLPPRGPDGTGYDRAELQVIRAALEENAYTPIPLPWPPVLDQRFFADLAALDFSVVDVGDHPESVAAVAFLHGHGIPALRLRQLSSGAPVASALERILYGGSSVGYPKDIVRWSSPSELDTLVRSRIQVIDLPPRRINSRKQAEDYFLETAKKPVNVFLSYSGQDQVVAAKISEALKKRFQKVFDYKDGSSIRPGEPWLQEIFRELAGSAVAVPLVSKDYYASDNCMHEAREIIAQRDSKLLHVIPIKLQETLPPPPEWFRDGQFERIFASDGDAGALVERIVKLVEERATRR